MTYNLFLAAFERVKAEKFLQFAVKPDKYLLVFLIVYLPSQMLEFRTGTSEKRQNISESEMENKLQQYRNREILHIFNAFVHNQTTGGILLLLCAIVDSTGRGMV